MDLKNLHFGIIGGSQGLGNWFKRFLEKHQLDVETTSLDENTGFETNIALVNAVDVVILAVPISAMAGVLEEIYPSLHHKTLIDVCSVKEFLVEKFIELNNAKPAVSVNYYSIHPMFSGKLEQLEGQVILQNYHHGKKERAWQSFKALFLNEKARWKEIDHIRHDKLMGTIQGLNHFNVFVSAKALSKAGYPLEEIKALASPPYHIFIIFFIRYVLQNPRLYAEIQFYNRYVLHTLQLFTAEMNRLMTTIESKDQPAFEAYIKEMQPYFQGHDQDTLLSDELIHSLGTLLALPKGGH